MARHDAAGALALLDERDRELAGLAADHPDRLEAVVDRALVVARLGRLDDAEPLAEAVLAGPAPARTHARALSLLADVALIREQPDRSEVFAGRARVLFESAGELRGAVGAIALLGASATARGEHRRARTLLREAAERLVETRDRNLRARVLIHLAEAAYRARDLRYAEEVAIEAERELVALDLESFRHGAVTVRARVRMQRGDDAGALELLTAFPDLVDPNELAGRRLAAWIALARGDRAAAEDHGLAALQLERGAQDAVGNRLWLAARYLEQGRAEDARARLREAEARLVEVRSGDLGELGCLWMWSGALEGDVSGWERGYAMACLAVGGRGDVGVHAARAALEAAIAWERGSGAPETAARSARSVQLALRQADQLENLPLARRCEGLLGALRGRAPIPVGDHDLGEEVGRGGFGVVIRARRRSDGRAAAVKVLTAEAARSPRRVASFEAEIRAIGSISHPAIATVWDYGTIDRAAELLSGGALPAGSPYLAMPFAAGGTLEPWQGRLPFAEVRAILGTLLRGVAAVHAAGVLHRDVKPANVLVEGASPADGVRLSDFGLAAPRESELRREVAAGTPAFMAPELAAGRWRAFGPWTDLYAVGCTAVALVAGAPPELLSAEPWVVRVPEPTVPVPPGFAAWLDRSLEPDPAARFRHAADALAALLALPEVRADERSAPAGPRGPASSTFAFSAATDHVAGRGTFFSGEDPGASTPSVIAGGAPTWPLIDREAELSALQASLDAVRSTARVRVVAVRGAPGLGRTRLAESFARAAEERGEARALRVSATDADPGVDGLLRRFLRTRGLTGGALRIQARDALRASGATDAEAARLAGAVGTAGGGEALGRVAWDVLAVAARERPHLIVLDDVESWTGALRFVEVGLEREEPAAVLVVVLCTDERVHARLAGREDERVASLVLRPLDRRACLRLLEGTLDLEPSAAIEVEARSAGNPKQAFALVEDWIAQRILVARRFGLTLARSVPPAGGVGGGGPRLEERLAALRPEAVRALELAAVLGLSFPLPPWRRACEAEGCAPTDGALEAAARARFLEVGSDRAAFPSAAVREGLLARARAAGRLPGHHRALARALEDAGDPGALGTHLSAAGEVARGSSLLLEAARLAVADGDRERALALVDRRQRVLAGAGMVDGEPEATLLRARLVMEDWGRVDDGISSLEGLLGRCDDGGIAVRAGVLAAVHLARAGRGGEAAPWASAAVERARRLGDPGLLAEALSAASEVHRSVGDPGEGGAR